MEKLEVEIPVSAGNKVYRTDDSCNIIEGIIERVCVRAVSLIKDTSHARVVSLAKDNVQISIVVKWSDCRDMKYYEPSDIGTEMFLSSKELIKHLVSML